MPAATGRHEAGSSRSSPHPSGDERFALLDTALRRARHEPHQLIEVLHRDQNIFEDVLLYVAGDLRLPRARVYRVATFYHLFRLEPAGEYTCSVCTGTACFVNGRRRDRGRAPARARPHRR